MITDLLSWNCGYCGKSISSYETGHICGSYSFIDISNQTKNYEREYRKIEKAVDDAWEKNERF